MHIAFYKALLPPATNQLVWTALWQSHVIFAYLISHACRRRRVVLRIYLLFSSHLPELSFHTKSHIANALAVDVAIVEHNIGLLQWNITDIPAVLLGVDVSIYLKFFCHSNNFALALLAGPVLEECDSAATRCHISHTIL